MPRNELRDYVDPLPPLDIANAATAISHVWRDQMHELELQNGQTVCVPIRSAGIVRDRVVEILKAYDYGRTQHIRWLTEELIRLHECLPGPSIIVKKTANCKPEITEAT